MGLELLKKITIAIDGPAASGKSTTARLVAGKLGYLHVDTGAMYRALTLEMLMKGINIDNEEHVAKAAKACKIELKQSTDGNMRVLLNGFDVTSEIRMPEVSKAVSTVSSYKSIRELMVREQRKIAQQGGVVLEGRDIGTIVYPEAELKIYMYADVGERARRRKKELEISGVTMDQKDLEKEISLRDHKDSTREYSPLCKAPDAIELDTTNLTIEEQVNFIIEQAKRLIETEKVKNESSCG